MGQLGGGGDSIKQEDLLILHYLSMQRNAVFEFEVRVLPYVRTPGIYPSDVQVKRLQCISVGVCAIHSWQKGLKAPKKFQRVNQNVQQDVESAYLGFMYRVRNDSRLPRDEKLRQHEQSESGRKPVQGRCKNGSTWRMTWCSNFWKEDSWFWILSLEPCRQPECTQWFTSTADSLLLIRIFNASRIWCQAS